MKAVPKQFEFSLKARKQFQKKCHKCLTLIFLLLFIILVQLLTGEANAQQKTFNYFPSDIEYDPEFPTPEEILGFEVGTWHVSHDQLVYYMKEIADLSDRITINEIGRTYENRPLLLLTITSSDNHAKIKELRKQHIQLSDPSQSQLMDIKNMPVVVWLGHTIHGNEASGSNASILTAYHWAAARGEKVDEILSNTIILLDPCQNPDGMQRFSTWINSNRSKNASSDPADREHNEPWPSGRTNHYWFDLNRDWLFLQHPESKARVTKFHEWKPNILTDHHEMGMDFTYYFDPGVPSMDNPLIPENTIKLTEKIAKYNAKALDEIGSFYYSKERFGNFYIGYGSTYPIIYGSIGICFEQASTRGYSVNTDNGELDFPFTIKNHFTTAYSTVLAANDLRIELLEHQRSFYKDALVAAKEDAVKAYIWNAGNDPSRANHFMDLLLRQQVEVFRLGSDQNIGGEIFSAKNSYIAPVEQPNYKMVKALFEIKTSFTDSIFDDISAWTLPLAFNLNYAEIKGKSIVPGLIGEKVFKINEESNFEISPSNYAYALRWDDYYAPMVLNRILEKEIIAKVATKEFSNDSAQYEKGTVIIPVTGQKLPKSELIQTLTESVKGTNMTLEAINSGYTQGVNLGSPSFELLRAPKVALLTGEGINVFEAGEVWHLLDFRMDMNITLLPVMSFNDLDLTKYHTLIMVDGNYRTLNVKKLRDWVAQGGLLIAQHRAGKWLSDSAITTITYKPEPKQDSTGFLPYSELERYIGARLIRGAIFNTNADLTHPLLYGFRNKNIPIFRNSDLFMNHAKGKFSNPLNYTTQPLIAGYISEENLEKLSGTAAISVNSLGRGRIITFTDDPNFRAIWYGMNRLFLNAIFFGPVINEASTR